MTLQVLDMPLSICKLMNLDDIAFGHVPMFLAITEDEISLVSESRYEPKHCIIKSDGWRAMKVTQVLDFSLTGIIADISGILAKAGIPIFALSTYDTDYILVKEERLYEAMKTLSAHGYDFVL